MGRGAHVGVLVRSAESLEALEKVHTLVVDKTGRLTRGKPELSRLLAAPGFDDDELLAGRRSRRERSPALGRHSAGGTGTWSRRRQVED